MEPILANHSNKGSVLWNEVRKMLKREGQLIFDAWILVPAFNEEKVIGEVLEHLLKISPNIVVVDDGSEDKTYEIISRLPVHALRHIINLGQGASLQTAINHALKNGAKLFVTFDADGQMDPSVIHEAVQKVRDGEADVVLGSRFLEKELSEIPKIRTMLLKAATLYTRLTTRLDLSDTHNGFRAFHENVALKVRLKQSRMAHASEFLTLIKKYRFRMKEVPIRAQYTSYSKQKGQSGINFLNILWDLLFH